MRNPLNFMRVIFILVTLVTGTVAHAAPTVTGIQLLSEKRISRTVFDYTYRITLQNDATARQDVAAQVGAVGAGTSIRDGSVSVGALAANQQVSPTDTITLRHDRLLPFSLAAITWNITGTVVPPDPPTRPGILVPGDPASTIEQSMPDHDSSRLVPESEISTVPNTGYRIIRTALYIVFRQDATVADVNAILNSINGRILSSFANNGAVSVGIPDPGSLPALYAVIADLKTRPAVEIVLADDIAKPQALPQDDYGANNLSYLDHHLAVRGAAAWNARRALLAGSSRPPSFLVYDIFGNGPPQTLFNQVNWKSIPEFGTDCNPFQVDTTECQHGYHVTGIALAGFGGNSDIGQVTGMYPSGDPMRAPVDGYVVDGWTVKTGRKTQIKRVLDSVKGNVVVNTSMAELELMCETLTDDELAIAHGRFWLRMLRGANLSQPSALENRYFHAAAAGNNTCGGDEYPVPGIVDTPSKRVAKYVASWTAASLFSDAELAAPALTNTLVIENREVIPGALAPLAAAAKAGCTYIGWSHKGTGNDFINPHFGASYTGGHVAGIGSRRAPEAGVWSYADAGPTWAGRMLGTSMASPQVAGLGIYLWTLRPTLTGPEVAGIIKANATQVSCLADISGTPVIDAYATILSADETFTDEEHPARKAILNANDDGEFDEADTQAFLNALFATTAGQVADYSRYDLNGDGFTGGPGTALFNLDISYDTNGKSTYSVLTSGQNGAPLQFDEERVTDFDILCYYVNSSLFPQHKLGLFELQLQEIRNRPGRANVTCNAPVAATITLSDSLAGWTGMPGTSKVFDLRATNKSSFQAFGNNNCTFGERGGPVFSSTVDADAVFFGASTSTDVPAQLFPGVNRRNCSSFVAYKNLGGGALKLWINATGRAVGFSGPFTDDWEYQTRLFSDGITTTCNVGTVPNSGNFAPTLTTTNCIGKILFAPAQ